MTGKKHGAFTTDLDVVAMKTFCKANSCTVNDYTTALISNTLYEYFDKNRVVDGVEYPIPDFISIGMPFSLR